MRIILVGFMGVGKTTIGKCLSAQLKYPFVDLDSVIESSQGMSVNDIFEQKGEAFFRKIELHTLKEALKKQSVVISTGGGAVCSDEVINFLKSKGIVIHLKRYEHDLIKTLEKEKATRPLIKDKTKKVLSLFIKKLYRKRRKFYNQADFVVYNNGKPNIVASRILNRLLN